MWYRYHMQKIKPTIVKYLIVVGNRGFLVYLVVQSEIFIASCAKMLARFCRLRDNSVRSAGVKPARDIDLYNFWKINAQSKQVK
ncbi:hypothetical protein [Undibacterium sp. Di26W]|uniref:hypothetical protein n=1 Tax=Undibacterium sp. Di26W TaxID=3413035 RepID=UPI003BF5BA05